MEQPGIDILLAFLYLALKHTLADFFLQTPYQYLNKGAYGHPGGLLHSGIHTALTVPVFLFMPVTAAVAVAVLAGEFVVHYHVDWLKEQYVSARELTAKHKHFWNALGVDQLAHQATYVAIVWVLLATR